MPGMASTGSQFPVPPAQQMYQLQQMANCKNYGLPRPPGPYRGLMDGPMMNPRGLMGQVPPHRYPRDMHHPPGPFFPGHGAHPGPGGHLGPQGPPHMPYYPPRGRMMQQGPDPCRFGANGIVNNGFNGPLSPVVGDIRAGMAAAAACAAAAAVQRAQQAILNQEPKEKDVRNGGDLPQKFGE